MPVTGKVLAIGGGGSPDSIGWGGGGGGGYQYNPSYTINGSPYTVTVGFIFNGGTSKWTCVAVA